MPNLAVNGEYASENIAERLNARERVLSWKDEDPRREREELILAAGHYSPAGTQILRQQDIEDAIVIDDGSGHRYVVAREMLETPEAYSRRRFRRWLRDAPSNIYEQWTATIGNLLTPCPRYRAPSLFAPTIELGPFTGEGGRPRPVGGASSQHGSAHFPGFATAGGPSPDGT